VQDRLDAVEELAFRALERGRLREALGAVQDLDRLLGRVAMGTAGPRDLHALGRSLRALPGAAGAVVDCVAPLVRGQAKELDPPLDLADDVLRTLVDEPPALVREGGRFAGRYRGRTVRAGAAGPKAKPGDRPGDGRYPWYRFNVRSVYALAGRL